jgi:T-complex protein 1 subunit theta
MSSAMAYNAAAGLGGMLKDGSRYFSQHEDMGSGTVVLRNIDACLQLSRMLSTSLGPQGRCKLVVNHLGKLNVTSDCASILKEIEIEHPAAQLLSMACQKQQEECGDQTNFVLAFGGELLYQTAKLIGKMTWQPAPEILAGYQRAYQFCRDELEQRQQILLDGGWDVHNKQHVITLLKPVLASKQYGCEEILAPLIADACSNVLFSKQQQPPETTTDGGGKKILPVEAIRTVKILGSSITQCEVWSGYVAKSGVETVVQEINNDKEEEEEDCKIVVFACGIEASSTEAKGTVLMKNAQDILNYNKTEEAKMEEIIQGIVNTGVKVVVTGGIVSDMALHFMDRHGLLCVKMGSKWELRRLCQAVGATALVRLGPPMPDEMGHCQRVFVREIGGRRITLFQKPASESSMSTILLRASTHTVLNDLERAVEDGVRVVAQAVKESPSAPQLVYGGGAIEMALSVALQQTAEQVPGLEQYAYHAFGKALEVIPRTLAENAGWNATQVLADLQAAHATARNRHEICDLGVDIEWIDASVDEEEDDATSTSLAPTTLKKKKNGTASMKEKEVRDLLSSKLSALRLAVDATITILKIDQIIMSKPSGGPKP